VFVGPPYEYVFTASATATDVSPNSVSPTITWHWKISGSATEHLIGTGTVREICLPTADVPCAGVARDVIARAGDGNTVGSDFIQVTHFPIC
jgi:hypothetical protein